MEIDEDQSNRNQQLESLGERLGYGRNAVRRAEELNLQKHTTVGTRHHLLGM